MTPFRAEPAVARALLQVAEEAVPSGVDGLVGTLTQLCTAVIRHLPASGSGITLTCPEQGPVGVAAAAGPASRQLEELQFTLGEGPCVDAHTARQPILEPDLAGAGSDRWPVYGPRAAELGVAAVFAFPLQVGDAQIGVLDIYRQKPGPLSSTELAAGFGFAQVAVRLLLQGQADAADGRAPDGLDEALAYRMEVYQAQGMVMVDLQADPVEAMARIRGHAFATGREVAAIAHDIIEGTLHLPGDHPAHPSPERSVPDERDHP